MAEVIDVREIPRGVQLVVRLENGEIHHLNFTRRHFSRLTDEELKRILRELEEDAKMDVKDRVAKLKGLKV